MALLFFSFALKNIFRNKWRSTFIILLLTIGIFALLISVTFNEVSENLVDNLNESMMSNSFGNENFSALLENYSNSSSAANLYYNNSDSFNTSSFNMSNIEDFKNDMTKGIKTLSFYMTAFLVLIGALLMMIVMLKAVGERTREIGVLKSIGWTNFRVAALILLESIFQLLISWIVVIVLLLIFYLLNGHAMSEVFNTFHITKFIVERIFTITFLTSLFIPIIGTIIPLLKAFRIKPSEAMRYE
ncbi:MAG: FtsX-like permease family protein [Methanobrevibacter sp.]|jgi:ABC-type antimicrobial peptide transport system permease subunit|nr:FtsX-like permease family protein [Methanobrevibacter sp.]